MSKILKKIPFWLKFTLIFTFGIVVLYTAGSLIEEAIGIESDMGTLTGWIFIVFGMLPVILFFNAIGFDPSSLIPAYAAGVLYYFIVGAIIGLFIQLIKSKISRKGKAA